MEGENRVPPKRPCPSLESTASSPLVTTPIEEDGEEVMGPSNSGRVKKGKSVLHVIEPHVDHFPNQGQSRDLRPLAPKPGPIANPTNLELRHVCNICGRNFKNQIGVVVHKRSHRPPRPPFLYNDMRPMLLPPPMPMGQALTIRPNNPQPGLGVPLELGLGDGNVSPSLNPLMRPGMVHPMPPGPTREWLQFREWLADEVNKDQVAALKNTEGVNNISSTSQPLSDEELELKLGF